MNDEFLSDSAPRFIADVHLGKLARLLRLLGFDTTYRPHWQKKELINLAASENSILLSREASFHKTGQPFLCLVSEDPETQLGETVRRFHLSKGYAPLTRRLVGNGMLTKVSKESVMNRLPEQTAKWYYEFWECNCCKRVFWKGAHYNCIQQLIERAGQWS